MLLRNNSVITITILLSAKLPELFTFACLT